MKTKITSLLIALMIPLIGAFAQNVITVNATSSDISDNLNLEAVATLFGEAENLQAFEQSLNNPENQISNLDLNEDGYVDYIRVVENRTDGVYLVTLQDVLGEDLYQDIATIDVQKDASGNPQIQIVGNTYIYGSDYIIEPVYDTRPLIFSYFWSSVFRPWVSPYYWNHYPHYFRPWRPYALYRYRSNIHRWIRTPEYYRYLTHRKSRAAMLYEKKIHRNDFIKRHPNRSFTNRYKNIKNRRELELRRKSSGSHYARPVNKNYNVRTNGVKKVTRQVKKVPRNNKPYNTYRKSNQVKKVTPTHTYRPKSNTVKRTAPRKSTVSHKPIRTNTNRNTYKKTVKPTNRTSVKSSRSSAVKKSRAVKSKPVKTTSKKKNNRQ